MIGLDTNVLVRFIVRDDEKQARAATRLIEGKCTAEDPGLVCHIVLCELGWVLERGYGYDRKTVASVIHRMLTVRELHVEGAEIAWKALHRFETGNADFADYVIGVTHKEHKAEVTYTFDNRAGATDLFQRVTG